MASSFRRRQATHLDFSINESEFFGGYHTATFQVASGAASNLVAQHKRRPRTGGSARTYLFTDHSMFQPNDKFAVMPIWSPLGISTEIRGPGTRAGSARGPALSGFLTNTRRSAFEAGFDNVRRCTGRYEGWLRKFTIAPQMHRT